MTDEALFTRAAELGVQCDYHDVAGQHHRADPAALAEVVAVLEADRAAADSVHASGRRYTCPRADHCRSMPSSERPRCWSADSRSS